MQSNRFVQLFSDNRALLPYSLLGVVAGLASAAVILAFDWTITSLGSLWLGAGSPDDFEALPAWLRFALPVGGAILLGLMYSALPAQDRETGIVHVLSRMESHYGNLPLRNAVVQFFGGAFALATGQSGGREGPGVHLGAAINSSIASHLHLPNNSQRMLIACGTAGGIAVAFNTPLAGVIFAMEVIIAEYTVIGFMPVILAAVSATALGRVFGDGAVIFDIPPLQMGSLLELPFVLLLGFAAGCVTALFIFLLRNCLHLSHHHVMLRFTAAGLITGAIALVIPQVMGMGYDSLHQALLGEMLPGMLLALVAAKLVATACSVGLGLPVGLIGPNLLIGACLGGALGYWGTSWFPNHGSDPTVYVVIGMGASMAAVLNAPLAALLAVVELTRNVGVVFPAMLAIVVATLTNTIVFRQRSAHQAVLRHLQREIPEDPISQLLHQTNVLPVMERDIRALPQLLPADTAQHVLQDLPDWCLLHRDGEALYLVKGKDLQEALADHISSEEVIDLTGPDIRRWTLDWLETRATLRQAMDTINKKTVEAVVISERGMRTEDAIRGVITRDTIEQYYLRRL